MDVLVGYTGFVGSNLHSQHNFDKVFNSKNITGAFGTNPDLCVYAGVGAEKFLANNDPGADAAVIKNAFENIKRINPRRLVLISTIDIFKVPYNCDETAPVEEEGLHPYGYNRYQLEKWCAQSIAACHVLRLPGLFGRNIKKNFIYDLIHILPSALSGARFNEFSAKESILGLHYYKQDNGFYKLAAITDSERAILLEAFERLGFSALNFTDSRSVFQFYNLAGLWGHIKFVIQNEIPLMHLAVEAVSAAELYRAVRGGVFVNEVADNPPHYDLRSIYAQKLGGSNGYIFPKHQSLAEVKEFIINEASDK